MESVDLAYCFKEQIDAGATDIFYYLLENAQSSPAIHTVERHLGSLIELLPFLAACTYLTKTNTTPPLPSFRKE